MHENDISGPLPVRSAKHTWVALACLDRKKKGHAGELEREVASLRRVALDHGRVPADGKVPCPCLLEPPVWLVTVKS